MVDLDEEDEMDNGDEGQGQMNYRCLQCDWVGPMDETDEDGRCPECHQGQFTLHDPRDDRTENDDG